MKPNVKHPIRCAALIALCACAVIASYAETGIKPEELLQKHLESIGTAEARAGAKSRVVEGTTTYKLLVGGSGEIQGTSVMVSEGNNLQVLLKISALKYHGERFTRNGDKTFVAGTYDDSSRSELGEFLRSEDLPLREGLIGGLWSAGWPLLNSESAKKLHYLGLKKVDGKELQAFEYRPKKSTDLDIALYFEPETFRHVLTIYKASVHAGIRGSHPDLPGDPVSGGLTGGAEIASAREQQTRYRIEERFGDFKQYDALTLPAHYDLRFTGEYSNGFTKTVEWDVTSTRVLNNVPLDPKNFVIR